MKELKIYKVFEKAIENLCKDSELKVAWFTTYNLDIAFVEDYILPLIAGMDSGKNNRPRSAKDYEEIQTNLLKDKIDIKFFADGSMIDYTRGKKTPIQIIDIQTYRFGNEFKYGVFHPKVIFLVNDKDKAWLMTGSANLSAAAWSINRESIWHDYVEDQSNFESIIFFFKKIMDSKNLPFPSDLIPTVDNKKKSNWKFISSLFSINALNEIISDKDKKLLIYSPYFSENIKKFCDNENLKGLNEIILIPDINENNKVRIDNANFEKTIEDKRIKFIRKFYKEDDEQHRFTHAKVWITESRISIGSWNFTEAGTGQNEGVGDKPKVGSNNIEAGVIIRNIENSNFEKFIPEKDVFNTEFMSKNELESEKDQQLFKIDFFISIIADWDNKLYKISLNDLDEKKASDFRLFLPDFEIDLKDILNKKSNYNFRDHKKLIKNHFYSIKSIHNDEIKYQGIIYEVGQNFRPAWRFDNFEELLYSYMQNDPDKYESYRLNYPDDNTSQEDEYIPSEIIVSKNDQTYYTLFSAFRNIKNKIKESTSEDLRLYIDSLPGCILEIAEKSKNELNKENLSNVWKWFLAEEVNSIIEITKNKIKDKNIDLKKYIKILDIAKLNYSIPLNELDKSKWEEWIKYIRKECDYEG